MTPFFFFDFLAQGIDDPNQFNNFMLLGYGVMWFIGLFYVLILANRQRNVREEIRLLHQLIDENEDSDE